MMRRLWAVVAATALLWPRVGGDSGEVSVVMVKSVGSSGRDDGGARARGANAVIA